MNKIVIIHDGPRDQSLVLTGVVKALQRKHSPGTVHVCTGPENHIFFQHMPGVVADDLGPLKTHLACDLLVDYGGSDKAVDLSVIFEPKNYMGLIPREETIDVDMHAYRGLYLKQDVNRNLFQLMFGVAGLSWAGEGYGFRYYPKSRQRKNRVGIAVRDRNVRRFLHDYLKLPEDRIWHIPFKDNILKQFDEVNKAASIVTDDPVVMHVGLSLRKRVELLTYEPPTIRPEFFGNGCIHLVPEELKASKVSPPPGV